MTEPTEPSEAGEPTAEAETSEAEAVEGDAPAETDAEPQETDFEGPRRRARREREERRAAQARATAIEEARREAKRRATGVVTTKKVGRGTVRGLKVLMWSALISVIVVGLGLLLYFTPVMSARNIVVVGLGAVTQEEVTNAAAVAPGTPLLQVDTDTVAERIAGIRRVATVRVQREYPSTLRVTIVEREPVVVKDYPDGPHLFDRDGVDFAIGVPPPGVP
jgi:cell division protein FtsQ